MSVVLAATSSVSVVASPLAGIAAAAAITDEEVFLVAGPADRLPPTESRFCRGNRSAVEVGRHVTSSVAFTFPVGVTFLCRSSRPGRAGQIF